MKPEVLELLRRMTGKYVIRHNPRRPDIGPPPGEIWSIDLKDANFKTVKPWGFKVPKKDTP